MAVAEAKTTTRKKRTSTKKLKYSKKQYLEWYELMLRIRRFEERARFHQRRSKNNAVAEHTNEKRYRESLNLPITGALKKAEIKAAYRRVAQKSHPDMGGKHEQFIFITKARDALLAFISSC